MNSDVVFHHDPLWNVMLRFAVTLIVLFVVIRLIYYRYSRKERTVFAFFQMGIMIFLVCILLKTVEIQLGVALGLFAIFAILRFRSKSLTFRDMAYFFTVIGVAVINAMATFYNQARGMILINLIIIVSILTLELLFNKRSFISTTVMFDRLDLLSDERKAELIADLSSRTGKQVRRADIIKIDLIKGTAELEVFFINSQTVS